MQIKQGVEKPKATATVTKISTPDNQVFKDLEKRCYTELTQIIHGIAGALDVSASSVMNMVAIQCMSQRLPETEEAMMQLPHVTKANFDKYGRALLDITQKYASEKKGL